MERYSTFDRTNKTSDNSETIKPESMSIPPKAPISPIFSSIIKNAKIAAIGGSSE
jgi:hypothetical protein